MVFIFVSLNANANSISMLFNQQLNPEMVDENRLKLLRAIELIERTKIGGELKPFIDELLQQDKIQLTKLQLGHYGESGEGCVEKEGEYYYEGLFILLNDKLNVEELASSLVHEVKHYQMIKELVALDLNFPVSVAGFEIAAFAIQYEFISELNSLNVINSQLMFAGDEGNVSEIMHNAFKLRNSWSEKDYERVFNQLVDFGYPATELSRIVSQRSVKDCFGMIMNKPRKSQ